jgi:hypothetical protein
MRQNFIGYLLSGLIIVGTILSCQQLVVAASPSSASHVSPDTLSKEPTIYRNDTFRCQMTLPSGWHDTNMTNKEAIFLLKKLPILDNKGQNVSAIIVIRQKFMNAPFKTFNELPSERVEAIRDNFVNSMLNNIKDKDKISVEGRIMDIGKHKVIWIVRSGNYKVIEANFLENGYLWSLSVGSPTEYFENMQTEMSQIIETFVMVPEN